VKFGKAEWPTRRTKFHVGRRIFGGFRLPHPPKKQKIAKIAILFSPPDVSEIRRVYVGNRSTEVVNISCNPVGKLGIYRPKTDMGHFPPKFSESPSSETTGPIEKKIK